MQERVQREHSDRQLRQRIVRLHVAGSGAGGEASRGGACLHTARRAHPRTPCAARVLSCRANCHHTVCYAALPLCCSGNGSCSSCCYCYCYCCSAAVQDKGSAWPVPSSHPSVPQLVKAAASRQLPFPCTPPSRTAPLLRQHTAASPLTLWCMCSASGAVALAVSPCVPPRPGARGKAWLARNGRRARACPG